MGRNVCCSISNLSIDDGAKAVFIPLVPNKDYHITKDHPSEYHLVGNVASLFGTNHYFNLASLPIFGEYDFYWGLKNIEENLNNSIIEKYFEVDIDGFVSCASSNHDDRQYGSPHQDILDGMSGMFILREVFDFLISGKFILGRGEPKLSHMHDVVGTLNSKDELDASLAETKKILVQNGLAARYRSLNPFKNNSDLKFEMLPYSEAIYRSSLKEGDLKQEFLDVFTLERAMYMCNRFFFPAMNGEQDGDVVAEKLLLDKSLEIVKRKLYPVC